MRRRRSPLAWLPWALLAAILSLVALMVLAGLLAGRAGEPAVSGSAAADSAEARSDTSGGSDTAAGGSSQAPAGAPGDGQSEQPAPGEGAQGQLVVGQTDVLADASSLGRLASSQGQPATGRGLVVQSVAADEGFWVGPSAEQRAFVHLLPEARGNDGESPFQVRAGQRVDLRGTVTGLPQGGAAQLDVTDPADVAQLEQQASYVEAAEVTLTE